MAITAVCTSCGHRFAAPDTFAGKRVKCKHCGMVFQIPSADPDEPGVDLDALASLESPNPQENDPAESAPPAFPNRIGPRLETRMAANPLAGDIPLQATPDAFGRANVVYFRYPGARAIDQWLPLALILAGFGWFAIIISRDDTPGPMWIRFVRFFLPALLYWILIFPITLAMLKKAGREMRFRMPPNTKLRAFAIYMPSFALAVVLWTVGRGQLGGLIVGALFGLVLSSLALFVLFRLREHEIPTTVSYGSAGFGIGFAISIGIIFGLNALTSLAIAQGKAQASVPSSPYGPGLSWFPPPETVAADLHSPLRPKHTATVTTDVAITIPTKPAPASPVLADVETSRFQSGIDDILRPLSTGSTIAIIRKNGDALSITAWDENTWQQQGDELKFSGLLGRPAISIDGQNLAVIATFPKRSIQIWSFATARLLSRIDLDPTLGNPELLGFPSPDLLMVRYRADSSSPTELSIVSLGSQSSVVTAKLPPLGENSATLAISLTVQRAAVAAKVDGTPTLEQFDLTTGHPLLRRIAIVEIDPNLVVAPTGLCYSNDGKRLAVMFEDKGNALLLNYDANSGAKLAEYDYPAPAGPLAGANHEQFKDNALLSLDPSPCWLLYGQGVIENADPNGSLIARLLIDHVTSARILDKDRVELITGDNNNQQITIATLDRAKILSMVQPPSTQPTTDPTPQP